MLPLDRQSIDIGSMIDGSWMQKWVSWLETGNSKSDRKLCSTSKYYYVYRESIESTCEKFATSKFRVDKIDAPHYTVFCAKKSRRWRHLIVEKFASNANGNTHNKKSTSPKLHIIIIRRTSNDSRLQDSTPAKDILFTCIQSLVYRKSVRYVSTIESLWERNICVEIQSFLSIGHIALSTDHTNTCLLMKVYTICDNMLKLETYEIHFRLICWLGYSADPGLSKERKENTQTQTCGLWTFTKVSKLPGMS